MPREKSDYDMEMEIVNLGLDDDDDEEEIQGLLGPASRTERPRRKPAVVAWNRPISARIVRAVAILLTAWASLRLVVKTLHHRSKEAPSYNFSLDEDANRTVTVPYQCQASIDRAGNDKDEIFDLYNRDTHRHSNLDLTLDELLHMKYGSWGITPLDRKELNANWIHWYADALQHDDDDNEPKTIYESACGVGLTLYVILQLLHERYNISGLEVYGNEYILDDVRTANYFYSHPQEFPFQRGRICHGDSTNLSFVPSNSFDVVLTGYIDPIVDPLNLHLSAYDHQGYCTSAPGSTNQTLMQKEQELVEDWFAAWAGEMIRIAKPGATIVVESISGPQCWTEEWGGVGKDWWATTAVDKYGWDVDPKSIEFSEFSPLSLHKGVEGRYNVKLVKRNGGDGRI